MTSTAKVQVNLNIEALLSGIQDMDTNTLATFAAEVNKILARRQVKSLGQKEAQLLSIINEGLPQQMLEQFEALRSESKIRLLQEEEEKMLQMLIEKIELEEARRLEALIHLAQLRNTTVQELRAELGIKGNF